MSVSKISLIVFISQGSLLPNLCSSTLISIRGYISQLYCAWYAIYSSGSQNATDNTKNLSAPSNVALKNE